MKFMVIWNNKKNIKKKAESAIATFLPTDEDKNPLIIFKFLTKIKLFDGTFNRLTYLFYLFYLI